MKTVDRETTGDGIERPAAQQRHGEHRRRSVDGEGGQQRDHAHVDAVRVAPAAQVGDEPDQQHDQ